MTNGIGSAQSTHATTRRLHRNLHDVRRAGGRQRPAPAPGQVDIGEAIAKLLIENTFKNRERARNERGQAAISMARSQQEQIGALRREAEERYGQACASAVGSIVSGSAGIAGGGFSFFGAFKSESASKAFDGAGKIAVGGGTLAAGILNLEGAAHERAASRRGIEAKAHEMAADASAKQVDGADDEIAEAREHARNAIVEFLKEFNATQDRTRSAAIHG